MDNQQARTHFCVKCNFPVVFYGRLTPCKHAFCLHCASEMAECHLCASPISRSEKVSSRDGLYISPVTLQSFTSREDFDAHTAAVQSRVRTSSQAVQ